MILRMYIHILATVPQSRSAAAPGAVRRPLQILVVSDATRGGKGLKYLDDELWKQASQRQRRAMSFELTSGSRSAQVTR